MRSYTEPLFGGHLLHADVVKAGSDINLILYGGSAPHIGSVVMAEARQSLTGDGMSYLFGA